MAYETTVCPICGKPFVPFPEHGLTDGRGKLVCTPACSTAAWKENNRRMEEKKERAFQKQRKAQAERQRLIREGIKNECSNPKPVDVYTKDGEFVAGYSSISDASRATGFAISTISNICRGERESAYGFTFRFRKSEG